MSDRVADKRTYVDHPQHGRMLAAVPGQAFPAWALPLLDRQADKVVDDAKSSTTADHAQRGPRQRKRS